MIKLLLSHFIVLLITSNEISQSAATKKDKTEKVK